jgi:hypothetical protein
MIGSRIGLAFAASASDITAAILIGAQIRPAAMHALSSSRLTRIKAVGRPIGIHGHFAAGSQPRIVVGPIPIGGSWENAAISESFLACRSEPLAQSLWRAGI